MRNGRRVIDTDCHQIEPPDLWVERIEPPFRETCFPAAAAPPPRAIDHTYMRIP